MFLNILAATAVSAAIIFLLWFARGAMLAPVRTGRNTRIVVMLCVSGRESRLEETVEGLAWLRENGTLPAEIMIVDRGMDDDTEEVARCCAVRRGYVRLCVDGDEAEWMKQR